MPDQDIKTCETCDHYVKFNNEIYECNYPMSLYLTCVESDRLFYKAKDVTESILPTDAK